MKSKHPTPLPSERPSEYAERVATWICSTLDSNERKQLGQFFTPARVARYMASMFNRKQQRIAILDPGAGVGILACALCESLVSKKTKPKQIILDSWEVDASICNSLSRVLKYLKEYLEERGTTLHFRIVRRDFVDVNGQIVDKELSHAQFDITICNPPYFKLGQNDSRVKHVQSLIHGQTNIYVLFMALSARLLRPNGELIFLVPRSFTSGANFSRFRKDFFCLMEPKQIHVFKSRTTVFKKDDVLQENIIVHAHRNDRWIESLNGQRVHIFSSDGINDMSSAMQQTVCASRLLERIDGNKIRVCIPSSKEEEETVAKMKTWPGSFAKFNIKVSTGQLVPHRHGHAFRQRPVLGSVPLLWMEHVKPMRIDWSVSLPSRKAAFVSCRSKINHLLCSAANYVVVRRFCMNSEDARALMAAPLDAKHINGFVGLENHLNYIYRPGGKLSRQEMYGLAAILNSKMISTFVRCHNGSTYIGAKELEDLPLPSIEQIRSLGKQLIEGRNLSAVDLLTVADRFLKHL
jgi:Predicted O-methyltransferase